MYQVLARRWRPQTFEQLVGQPQIARTLTNALRTDRLAHAYIFAGLRGTGKTTVARILAKCLNCEGGPTTTPCDKCDSCVEIAGSRSLDVLEIDAASRTKVEQTRELLEVVSYAAVRDRYKVLIIDEAHMLSKASFNALLKTLEEPPPGVVFVLATTELQKILPTILSRCQVFEFRRVRPAEIAAHLRVICDKEKIRIPDLALDRMARSGEGSVRDALSLLERAMAFAGNEISDDDVVRMLGAVQEQVLTRIIEALARRDAAGMLEVLDGLIDQGHDLVHFWGALLAAIRDLLLLRTLPDPKDLLARTPDEAQALVRAAEDLSREDLTRTFQILADLEFGLKSSSQPRFLFEAMLIRLASLGAVRPIEELLQSLPAREGLPAQVPRQKKNPVETTAPVVADKRTRTPEPKTSRPTDLAGVLVNAIRDSRPMLAAMLEQASRLHLEGKQLRIEFPDALAALKRQIEGKESLALIVAEAERLAGHPVRLQIESISEPAVASPSKESLPPARARSAPPTASSSRAAPDEPAEDSGSRVGSPGEGGSLLEQARSEPGVQKLLDAFGAHVVGIEPQDDPATLAKPPKPPRTGPKNTRAGRSARPPEESP